MPEPGSQWTIKSVNAEVRNAFILAARKANMSMGAWFNRYGLALVQAFLDNAGPDFTTAPNEAGKAVVPVGPTAANTGNHDNLETVERLARLARDLAGDNPKARVLQRARRIVESRLRELEIPKA